MRSCARCPNNVNKAQLLCQLHRPDYIGRTYAGLDISGVPILVHATQLVTVIPLSDSKRLKQCLAASMSGLVSSTLLDLCCCRLFLCFRPLGLQFNPFICLHVCTGTAIQPLVSACVCRAMMNNPESLRQMLSPENMQAMLQMQQAMQQLQGTGLVPPAPAPGAAGLGTEGAFAFTACKSVLAVSGLARID